jgi:hypothetical protein
MARTQKIDGDEDWGTVGAVIGFCIPLCLAGIGYLVPFESTSFLSPEAGKLLESMLCLPIHLPFWASLSANPAWDEPWQIRGAGLWAMLCPILNLAVYAALGAAVGLWIKVARQTRDATERMPTEFLWYKTTFGRLMLAGPFMSLVIPAGLIWIEKTAEHSCDRDAEDVLRKTFASLVRLSGEARDCGCTSIWPDLSEEQLKFMAGPYYGWSGTTGKGRCGILLSFNGQEIRVCAMRGTHPTENPKDRHIFSALRPPWNAEPEKASPAIRSAVGTCTGKAYGYGKTSSEKDAPYYVETMLESASCTFRVPRSYYENMWPKQPDS